MGTQAGVDLIYSTGKQLQGQGHEVLFPHAAELSDYSNLNAEEAAAHKSEMIWNHLHKIEQSDAVLVTNGEKKGIEGYIGANTFLEMTVAMYLNKPVYLLNPINRSVAGYEEILGMKPVFLNGNLENLK